MQIISETKATKETLNKRRNLFGLGLTSLIVACGDKAAGGSGDGGGGSVYTATLPFKTEILLESEGGLAKAEKLAEATGSGYTAEIETSEIDDFDNATDGLDAKITKTDDGTSVFLNFPKGGKHSRNAADIYKLTDTYDLVISASIFDKDQTNASEARKGRVFIYWDVATVTVATSPHLEIKGGIAHDRIGQYPSEFFQLGGATEGGYDMVIRSHQVDKPAGSNNEGAIYVLWDVANYIGSNTIDLGKLGTADENATAGSLAIYGASPYDVIGTHAPEFLQLGGEVDNYDMVIRSEWVDKSNTSFLLNEGAIYILWDINDYYQDENSAILNKRLDLGAAATDTDIYATSSLLTIYGAATGDQIGIHVPEFLQLGGKDGDNKLDMVIRSDKDDLSNIDYNAGAIYVLWDVAEYADENISITLDDDATNVKAESGLLTIRGAAGGDQIGTYAPEFLQLGGAEDGGYDMAIRSEYVNKTPDLTGTDTGAIYVLWDVADYAGENINITLNDSADGVKAESGLLTIKGTIAGDQVGIHETEFLQLGKENDKYDLIIRSEHVDKTATSAGANTGAIYVLWDVADYAGGNETITLTSLSDDASSGLLTIYGTAGSSLGSSNILYRDDSDVDDDGTNDLVFKDKDYTYVLFGDQLGAVNADTGKVTSKTIDLDQIQVNTNGFFGYAVDAELGYRFDGSKTFEAVKATFSSSLSDTDSDLGVWDIA